MKNKKKDSPITATVSVGGQPPVPLNSPEATKMIAGALKAAGHGPRVKDVEETIRHNFTDAEFLQLGRNLAEANIAAEASENEKKSVTATLKAKCEGCIAKVTELSNKLSAGYEYRPVACQVTFDDPTRSEKTTRRLDTKEVVKTEPMTLADMQQRLPGLEEAAGD